MKKLLGKEASEGAADNFPDDVLFGGQWLIDTRMVQNDPSKTQFTLESHVKALVVTLASAIAAGVETA